MGSAVVEDASALGPAPGTLAQHRLKWISDLVVASLLIIVTLPVMVLAGLAVRLTSPGSVIFRQRRVGYRGQEFVMYKFRTMDADAALYEESLAETNGNGVFFKIEDDARVTPVGRFLRRYSLDELPQLFNVLRGEMSLVGPRPLLLSDMKRFPPGVWSRRFTMWPGMTGLWQVSGRSRCSDAERIRLDLEYVDRWSPWLDFWILLRTPMAVLTARGAF